MNDVNFAKACRKELLYSLQAKGKLERPSTEAGTRRDNAYHHTLDRIFPQRDNEEQMSKTLLEEARTKLASGQMQQKQHPCSANSKIRPERRAVKDKLRQLEEAVAAQRTGNKALEQEISSITA